MMIHLNGLGTAIENAADAYGNPLVNETDLKIWCYSLGYFTDNCATYRGILNANAGNVTPPPTPLAPPPVPPDMDPVTGEVLNPDAVENLYTASQSTMVESAQHSADKANVGKKDVPIPWYVWAALGIGAVVAIKRA